MNHYQAGVAVTWTWYTRLQQQALRAGRTDKRHCPTVIGAENATAHIPPSAASHSLPLLHFL